jgi:hypothetical protein
MVFKQWARFSLPVDCRAGITPEAQFDGVQIGGVVLNPNSEVGTVLGSGAAFQPAISGKPYWKNLPQLPGGN